jgi:hypothetical protein
MCQVSRSDHNSRTAASLFGIASIICGKSAVVVQTRLHLHLADIEVRVGRNLLRQSWINDRAGCPIVVPASLWELFL